MSRVRFRQNVCASIVNSWDRNTSEREPNSEPSRSQNPNQTRTSWPWSQNFFLRQIPRYTPTINYYGPKTRVVHDFVIIQFSIKRSKTTFTSGTASRKQSVLQHLWPCSECHWKRNYSRDPVPTNILTNCTNTWRLHYWLLIVPWPRSFFVLMKIFIHQANMVEE